MAQHGKWKKKKKKKAASLRTATNNYSYNFVPRAAFWLCVGQQVNDFFFGVSHKFRMCLFRVGLGALALGMFAHVIGFFGHRPSLSLYVKREYVHTVCNFNFALGPTARDLPRAVHPNVDFRRSAIATLTAKSARRRSPRVDSDGRRVRFAAHIWTRL